MHVMYRLALRHNKTVLMFKRLQETGQIVPTHLHPLFQNITQNNMQFSFLMEHVKHNNEMVYYLMPSDTMYFSSLRHPLEQLKSHLHFVGKDDKTHGDPVLTFMKSKMAKSYKGALFFRIPEGYNKSIESSYIYIKALRKQFHYVLITDHFDESLLMLKRHFCWDLKDIVYVPLKVGDYHFGNYNETLLSKHREMFKTDYLLFNAYNKTLWNDIEHIKQDFYLELTHFRKILQKLYMFCEPVKKRALARIKRGTDLASLIYSQEKLVIAESEWNNDFSWDIIDCLLSYVKKHVMRGIFIQRQHPDICKKDDLLSPKQPLGSNGVINDQLKMNTAFCDTNRLKYNIPLAVLSSKDAYDLFSDEQRPGIDKI